MLLNKIKQLCGQKRITISELEKNLGFGNATIRKWDKAQPSVDKVMKVADYFKISIDYLLNPELKLLSNEAEQFARTFDSLSEQQKSLIKCYISIIKKGGTLNE